MSDLDKITEQHRHRRAIVYVRQSSPGQVQNNHESRALQYALRDRAIELGWPAESVCDRGRGSGPVGVLCQRAAGV